MSTTFTSLRKALGKGYRTPRQIPKGFYEEYRKPFGGSVERKPGPYFIMTPLEMWAWRMGRKQRWTK